MKAYDFEFDGRPLSSFNMVICNFDSKGMKTVSNGSFITFNTVSTNGGSKHELTSTEYEDCLETTIQICKDYCSSDIKEISSAEFRELTKWLCRKRFLKFKILDEDYIDLYFEASFNVSRIEFDGKLYGLELEVVTNRPYALMEPKTFDIRIKRVYVWEKFKKINGNEKGESTGEYVTSHNRSFYPDDGIKNGYYFVYIREELDDKAAINDISHEEGYIYPYTEIIVNESGNLNIYNAIEDRNTYIANCVAGEVITMNYPIILSSISSHNIQDDFNYNFFRKANTFDDSRNDLTVSLPCTIKATYSPIVKVGL